MLSTVGGVVLLKIVVSCWLCYEAFCVNAVAKDVDPLMTSLRSSLIGVVVIVEPPCCGASPTTVFGCWGVEVRSGDWFRRHHGPDGVRRCSTISTDVASCHLRML